MRIISLIALSLIMTQGFALQSRQKKIVIAVLDAGARSDHEKKVITSLKKLIKKCNSCQIKSYPIYADNGDLTQNTFVRSATLALDEADIIHLSWNIPSVKNKTEPIEQILNKLAKEKILVAAAGAPEVNVLSAPLNTTVIGKVKEALIVGELNAHGNLDINSFYGEEMFTALPTIDNLKGSSFSSLRLTAAIAIWVEKNKNSNASELKNFLQEKKNTSSKKYPSLKDLTLN